MSSIEITPELLRQVAEWGESRGLIAGMARIRTEADNLEREQEDEKRMVELERAFLSAAFPGEEDRLDRPSEPVRRGIRAVIWNLEEGQPTKVKPVGWYRTMNADFATEHFGFPPIDAGKFTASDGGKWAWMETDQLWELVQYGMDPQ